MVAPQSTDVVIVGAGIAGLSLALGLARHGMKVTIVEAGSQPATPSLAPDLAAWDSRVSALTPSSSTWLAEHGVWQEIERHRAGPYTDMLVWDGAGTGRIAFSAASLEVHCLGILLKIESRFRPCLSRYSSRQISRCIGTTVWSLQILPSTMRCL